MKLTRRIPLTNVVSISVWALALAVALIVVTARIAFGLGPLSNVPDPREPGPDGLKFSLYTIPGLPADATLGSMWMDAVVHTHALPEPGVANAGRPFATIPDPYPMDPDKAGPKHLYVWVTSGTVLDDHGGYSQIPDTGEPRDHGTALLSKLYRWDGVAWSASLTLPVHVGRSVYGPTDADVYAAADCPTGDVCMYRFHGGTWARQSLPDGLGHAGAIDGQPGDLYFRAADKVLHFDGASWTVVYTDPHLKGGGALVYIAPNEVYVMGPAGHAQWNGSVWQWHSSAALGEVHHAWGARDASGALLLYATGRSISGHMAVWKYIEGDGRLACVPDEPGTPEGPSKTRGGWGSVDGLPIPGLAASTGQGMAIWGSTLGHVIAMGEQEGFGRMFMLEHGQWNSLLPSRFGAIPVDVVETETGDIWASLSDGRLLHFERPLQDAAAQHSISRAAPMMTIRTTGSSVHEFEISLPEAADVRLTAFDLSGRSVALLEHGYQSQGTHRVRWNVQGLAPGLYFCQLKAGSNTITRKFVLR